MPTVAQVASCFDAGAAVDWAWEAQPAHGARAFAAWLAGWWQPHCPPAPPAPPDATSRVGGDAGGLRWFARGEEILGYPAGGGGCYRIPAAGALPAPAPTAAPARSWPPTSAATRTGRGRSASRPPGTTSGGPRSPGGGGAAGGGGLPGAPAGGGRRGRDDVVGDPGR